MTSLWSEPHCQMRHSDLLAIAALIGAPWQRPGDHLHHDVQPRPQVVSPPCTQQIAYVLLMAILYISHIRQIRAC